jgi:hypothetical protein
MTEKNYDIEIIRPQITEGEIKLRGKGFSKEK